MHVFSHLREESANRTTLLKELEGQSIDWRGKLENRRTVFPSSLRELGSPESAGNYFCKRTETESLRKNGKEKSLADSQKPASH